ncbi:MAG TPA: hypothetical protein VFL90_04390, partial [Methylomirabilota bacterium]|nr:hypothetical protein [Methylomirabilota bacterium]
MVIGILAHRALARTGGRARVTARLPASTYMSAGGELLWLGPVGAEPHPRAVLLAQPSVPDADEVTLDAGAL